LICTGIGITYRPWQGNLHEELYVNSPDSLLNDSTGLAGLTVPGLSYFFKVSPAPDFENKIPPTVESGFEP